MLGVVCGLDRVDLEGQGENVDEHQPAERNYDLERLIFLSDGVFAIVITLLVIELHPPAEWDSTLGGLWRSEGQALVAYAVSFLAVGTYWNLHRRLFRRVTRFRGGLIFFNLLLLAFVVLVPFGARLILSGPIGEPFALFFGLLVLIGVAQALLWSFAAFVGDVVERSLSYKARLGFLANLLAAPLISGVLVVAILSKISLFWVLPICIALGLARRFFANRFGLRI